MSTEAKKPKVEDNEVAGDVTVPGEDAQPHSNQANGKVNETDEKVEEGGKPTAVTQSGETPTLNAKTADETTSAPATFTGSTTVPAVADDTRRQENKSSATTTAAASSEGANSSVPTNDNKNQNGNSTSKKQTKQPSLLSKVLRKLVPCIGPSNAHAIDIDDGLPQTSKKDKGDKDGGKKATDAAVDPASGSPEEKLKGGAPSTAVGNGEKKAAPPELELEPSPLVVATHTSTPEGDVLSPPTPTSHLLPKEVTEGMTSGAVQPPGSTGTTPTSSTVLADRAHTPTSSQHQPNSAQKAEDSAREEEESDGTSYQDDEDMDDLTSSLDDAQDEEDRLIMNGGAGIPIIDGVPKPLLPPIAPHHAGRKCLVLDLDETLVHSSFKSIQQADYVVPVEIEFHWHNVYVIKRPGVDNFLKLMGEKYEVVVFTASLSKYADPVLDKLDIHQVVTHRLFRESCYNHKGNYVKDLSQLGRPIGDTIILDNSPASYIFHPNNAVPVSSWFNDPHDTELTDLIPFLADLSEVDDVRGILDGAR